MNLPDTEPALLASPHPLVTYVRCRFCRAENTIIGPSSIATVQHPDWRISQEEFYKPDGKHFCPEHSYKEWFLWCFDIDCGTCYADGGLPNSHRRFPYEWTAEQIYNSIKDSGWHCPEGNIFGGFQSLDGQEIHP